MTAFQPSPKLRLALLGYAVLWWVLLPIVLLYLCLRGRKDAGYTQHLGDRFGGHVPLVRNPVWIHAVSLGEMRSATPLVRGLLAKGETVLTTHFTPAGRREAMREFAPEIAAGKVQVAWTPLEYSFAYRRFLKKFAPKYGLVMEIEVWPVMIMECRKNGTPLFMCNAQYPEKSFAKDGHGAGLRARLMGGFAGGFVKSQGQADRFAAAGMSNIHITGELRFDQPIPQAHLDAAQACRQRLTLGRPSYTLTSVVEGEDAIYIDMIKRTRGVFFAYVPRAPERFDEVAAMLVHAGLRVGRRTELLDERLALSANAPEIDVLLGDSMGEMYFYLGLCDRAIVGGGFVPKGAHNIIEPLALRKPVVVGPHIWTIEYPATEAIAAKVCQVTPDAAALLAEISSPTPVEDTQITTFYNTHAGAVARTMAAIPRALNRQ